MDKESKCSANKKRTLARQAGKPYETSSGKTREGKKPPSKNVICKCKYKCKDISEEQKELLFLELYKLTEEQQGTYLLNRIHAQNISRRRHGTYDDFTDSRRQITFSYVVPDGNGQNIQVCSATFKNIFSLTPKKLQTLQAKKKEGHFVYVDNRGKNPKSHEHKCKYSDNDRNLVSSHILSFPRHESHYARKKSSLEYLSPDLNKHRLFTAFKERYPDSNVSYRYYSKVFELDFPKLKFGRMTVDSCKKCDKLKAAITIATRENDIKEAETNLQLHHRKAEKAQECMKEDMIKAQNPGSDTSTLCMDLQQVMFVPMLTHNTMFYSRQLSTYNLGLHVSDYGTAFMCMWHEGNGGRGGNEIASCFFKLVTSERITKKKLVVWCDNCTAQNKNKMILMAIIYLIKKQFFESIEIKYLVSGHSFMNCDRDFGLIEKRRRTSRAMIPSELEDVVRTARINNPFNVISMKKDEFIDFAGLSKEFLTTQALHITKASHIKISHKKPHIVKLATSFSFDPPMWTKVNVLKKNKNLNALPSPEELPKVQFVNKISKEKKKDLQAMIEYLTEPHHRTFYEALLQEQEGDTIDPSEDLQDE